MGKKGLLILLPGLTLIVAIIACNAGLRVIQGSGNVVTETRPVSNFDSIDLIGSGEVIITQSGNESLTIETDDNVMEHVKAEVEGGTLKLGLVTGRPTGVNIQSTSRLVFYVGVDDLSSLDTSGSGEIEADRIETGNLDLSVSGSGAIQIADLIANEVKADISGSGEIGLVGEADAQDVNVSGSGIYQAGEVCSAEVNVSVSGSGNATVCATDSLDASVSGSGTIDYYGNPLSTNTSESGSGSVNNLGE